MTQRTTLILDDETRQQMGERLVGPEVIVTETQVLIALAALPRDTDSNLCPGNPDQAVLIQLDQPLGDREIADGLLIGLSLDDLLVLDE